MIVHIQYIPLWKLFRCQ